MNKLVRTIRSFFLLVAISFFPFFAQAIGFCDVRKNQKGLDVIKVPCLPTNNFAGPAGSTSFGDLIVLILDIALLVIGSLAVIGLVIGGFRYVTAYGNEESAEAAKKTITHAVLGILIVVLAFAMIRIISNILISGKVSGP